MTLYGIKNCDTVKKARAWLDAHDIAYPYHDLREDGLDRQQVAAWLDNLGWEALINRRGTSWKKLDETARQAMDDAAALAAILRQSTLIKRPLLDIGGEIHCGFTPEQYEKLFNRHTL